MTVTTTERSRQVRAAEELESAVRTFADGTREIVKPSDGGALLLRLAAVQSTLGEVYAALSRWHAGAVKGRHHAGDDERGDPENPSWLRAGVALEEAAQYSRDAASALDRARTADEVALWFDELQVDEEV